jgi:hypothetical protein
MMFFLVCFVGYVIYALIDSRDKKEERARKWEQAKNRAFRGE